MLCSGAACSFCVLTPSCWSRWSLLLRSIALYSHIRHDGDPHYWLVGGAVVAEEGAVTTVGGAVAIVGSAVAAVRLASSLVAVGLTCNAHSANRRHSARNRCSPPSSLCLSSWFSCSSFSTRRSKLIPASGGVFGCGLGIGGIRGAGFVGLVRSLMGSRAFLHGATGRVCGAGTCGAAGMGPDHFALLQSFFSLRMALAFSLLFSIASERLVASVASPSLGRACAWHTFALLGSGLRWSSAFSTPCLFLFFRCSCMVNGLEASTFRKRAPHFGPGTPGVIIAGIPGGRTGWLANGTAATEVSFGTGTVCLGRLGGVSGCAADLISWAPPPSASIRMTEPGGFAVPGGAHPLMVP